MTTSVCIVVATATPAASVIVTLPPAAGTVAEPLELAEPLFTAAWIVAPPQAAGRLPTVTLTTEAPERLLVVEVAAVVQRGTLTLDAPRPRGESDRVAARPAPRPATANNAANAAGSAASRSAFLTAKCGRPVGLPAQAGRPPEAWLSR